MKLPEVAEPFNSAVVEFSAPPEVGEQELTFGPQI